MRVHDSMFRNRIVFHVTCSHLSCVVHIHAFCHINPICQAYKICFSKAKVSLFDHKTGAARSFLNFSSTFPSHRNAYRSDDILKILKRIRAQADIKV